MQFKDLASQLASESAEPLEGTVITRTGKKDRQINTFVLRTETRPARTLYKKAADRFREAQAKRKKSSDDGR